MRFLTTSEVEYINRAVIEFVGAPEPVGIRDHSLLESALARPQQSVFGVDAYPSIPAKAAALVDSLINNHPALNGNKRTALVALIAYLRLNGLRFIASQKDAEDFVVDVAEGKYDLPSMTSWVQQRTI